MTVVLKSGPPFESSKYFKYTPTRASSPDAPFFISTAGVDADGDRVFPEGADLETYRANPVVLWLHDAYGNTGASGIPIGSSKALEIVQGRGVRTQGIDWLEGDEFADRVRNAWEQDKIRAASIGFRPREYTPNEHGGYDIKRWLLLEWSLVPIPANPGAVRSGLVASLKALGVDLDPALFDGRRHAQPQRISEAINDAFKNLHMSAAVRAAFAHVLAKCKGE